MAMLLHQLQMPQHRNPIGRLLVHHPTGLRRNVALRDEHALRKVLGLLPIVLPQRQLLRMAHALALLVQQRVLVGETAHDHRVEELPQFGQRFAASHVLRNAGEIFRSERRLEIDELQGGRFHAGRKR